MDWDEEVLREDLVLESLGNYLKLPDLFKSRYELKGKRLPDPRASVETRGDRVRLVYTWTRDELQNAEPMSKNVTQGGNSDE